MNVNSYKTIRNGVESLDESVTAAIHEEWEPFGSPYVIKAGVEFLVCQAMVKEKEAPKQSHRGARHGSG